MIEIFFVILSVGTVISILGMLLELWGINNRFIYTLIDIGVTIFSLGGLGIILSLLHKLIQNA